MTEKAFYFSKKKELPRGVISLVIFCLCSQLVYGALSAGQLRRIGILILAGIVGLGAGLYLVASIMNLLSKPDKEITLTKEGIAANSNSGKVLGVVPWSNIERIAIHKISNKNKICVQVKDVSPYLNKYKKKEQVAMLENNRIALLIDNKTVDEDLPEILKEIQRFFKNYGSSSIGEPPEDQPLEKPQISTKQQVEIPLLPIQVFMHYHSGKKEKPAMDNQHWLNQHVFFWRAEEPFEKKSLPPEFREYEQRFFLVAKPLPDQIKVAKGTVMPWFDMPGGGEKYFFGNEKIHMPVEKLLKAGYLQSLTPIDKKNHIYSELGNLIAVSDEREAGSSNGQNINLTDAVNSEVIELYEMQP